MSATDQDVRALEHLAARIREDTHGCGPWDRQGIHVVFDRELKGIQLVTAIELVLAHAQDPEAKTPGAITRGFTPHVEPVKATFGPPKAAEVCPRHPAYRASNCGGCEADKRADDQPASPPPAWEPGDAKAGADLARAAIGRRSEEDA